VYPAKHVHTACPTAGSLHVPPFRHGDDPHSRTSVSHLLPVYPVAHKHPYPFTPSTHVPPFVHGDDPHSFTLLWHTVPVKPAAHKHT
jgi:hypothetical protein